MSIAKIDKDGRSASPAAINSGAPDQSQAELCSHDQIAAAAGHTGTVKWFNLHKGFGFIRPAAGGDDVFVHISALVKTGLHSLEERQFVGFDLEQDPKTGRMSATNIRLLR